MKSTSPILTVIVFFTQLVAISCSGMIEIVVSSPKTVLISSTVCTTIRCSEVDDNARKVKLNAGNHLRFRDAPYAGEAPRYYDLHLSIFNTSGEQIGSVWVSPDTDIRWQNGAIGTDAGFNVTYRYRNMCDNKYYGIRCERFCEESVERHTECSLSGERKCMDGWTGDNCMTPICKDNCGGRGKCVAPGKCHCNSGYSGNKCEECTPKIGCVHGGCANNVSFTCTCLPGYGGELCDLDLEYCQRHRPCHNGGLCTNSGSGAFKCHCPDGFVGEKCEIPVHTVLCKQPATQEMCMNGGVCISLNDKNLQCHCPAGYYGKFCELGAGPCSSVDCKNGGICSVAFRGIPQCKCATCYKGSRCEIFDAECLVSRMNASLSLKSSAIPPTETTVSSTTVTIVMVLIVIALVATVFLAVLYCKMRKNLREANAERLQKSTRRPQHKVCVIDDELSRDSFNGRIPSPPPAYYPPGKAYKTLPMEEPRSTIRYPTVPATNV